MSLAESSVSLPFVYLRFTIGNVHFSGRTTLEIQKSGQARLRFQQAGDSTEYSQELSGPDRVSLLRELTENDPEKIEPINRSPAPGEERIVLELARGEQPWRGEYWTNDQAERPALRRFVKLLEDVARKVSEGKIRF
jgi:hypothetical protein